ncbi:CopD family protein [Brevundimonas sp.]|uniref:CopD family protein n=1 Tax=Brevundimonas sp. TaxID=1871086 RepID=UPI003D1266F0
MILYDVIKAGHIVALLMWSGGMMAVALVVTKGDRETMARFRSWDQAVTTPAMIVTWGLGLTLSVWGGWLPSGWLMSKLAFVLVMSAVHGFLSGQLRKVAANGDFTAKAGVRIAMPAIFVSLSIVVLLVETKPF